MGVFVSKGFECQGCGLRKITRSPNVPDHKILGAKHLSLCEKCQFFQLSKGKKVSCLRHQGTCRTCFHSLELYLKFRRKTITAKKVIGYCKFANFLDNFLCLPRAYLGEIRGVGWTPELKKKWGNNTLMDSECQESHFGGPQLLKNFQRRMPLTPL